MGNTSLSVSRMGISGHYALPERGFAEALERGINAYFWEPIYMSQSRFFKPLSKQAKSDLVMCCGTFEASAHGLRRDLERALAAMDLEQIQVFYRAATDLGVLWEVPPGGPEEVGCAAD